MTGSVVIRPVVIASVVIASVVIRPVVIGYHLAVVVFRTQATFNGRPVRRERRQQDNEHAQDRFRVCTGGSC